MSESAEDGVGLEAAAASVGVTASQLQDWVAEGVVPEYAGSWTEAVTGKARLVRRLLERGHTLAEIREATEAGRLVPGAVMGLFGVGVNTYGRMQVARETGLDASVVERVAAMLGLADNEALHEPDRDLLRYVSAALAAGLPMEAILQLTRVYIQAVSQIADAEVRLMHLYVHEPLIRSGGSAEEMNRELQAVTEELVPLTSPLLRQLHGRMLSHFIEQDIVGHMESDLGDDEGDLGRMLVAIVFADLAGYTRLTEREGELHALGVVEHFLDTIHTTLPDGARVIKTLGDEAMIVGPDPAALASWAVTICERLPKRPRPRIAIHYGYAHYRDGDYYGREVNLAARVAGEPGAGHVVVTRPVVEASGPELQFQARASVRFRGFRNRTELFRASRAPSDTT